VHRAILIYSPSFIVLIVYTAQENGSEYADIRKHLAGFRFTIYDPEAGDYERHIPPGTPFEDLPDDWCCPKCGAEKEFFEELND